jgi:beta-barrel assembly-enhancing protease
LLVSASKIVDPPFLRRSRIRGWTAIAATLVAAMVAVCVIVPAASSVFAYLIPDSTKRALGASTVSQLFGPAGPCEGEAGAGALSRLSHQLADTMDLNGDIEIHVTKFPMINAFALPGRHMVLTEKLIEKSKSSAELAAVIAHEFGHMKLDHPTEACFRRGLISAVVDAIFGGGIGGDGIESVAAMAITFSYSREAEAEADKIGIDALNSLGITTQGMADFFDRQSKPPGLLGKTLGKLDWLSTHTGSEERRRNALEQGTGRNQAFSEKEWKAVGAICR